MFPLIHVPSLTLTAFPKKNYHLTERLAMHKALEIRVRSSISRKRLRGVEGDRVERFLVLPAVVSWDLLRDWQFKFYMMSDVQLLEELFDQR